MSIKLSDSIRVGQQKPLEDKYFNELVPYTSTIQVNTLVPIAVRHIGLTVNIDGEEYWYKDGIEDANLVLKVPNIDGKLNKPTTTSNTTSYPFVVGEDGNGGSARLPAGDLGKNFFNSDLSNTTARNHTMNAGVTVNTLGNPHILSGLPNKNADIANFRKVRVQNTSGLDAVVDSKNLLTDGLTSMTDAEKDAWRLAQRKSGETYSTGMPQVDAILPPIINGNETKTEDEG